MIKVIVIEKGVAIHDARKVVICPRCGQIMTCLYISPPFCTKCDEALPDVLDMLTGDDSLLDKLLYHRTGRTGTKKPRYLTGNYDG